MKVYRFWVKGSTRVPFKGKVWTVAVFGSSNESPEDAQRDADERAEELRRRMLTGEWPDTYGYGDRPLREEVKREVHRGDELAAVITRNAAGCLVLNTARVMLIDMDVPPEPFNLGIVDAIYRLFGKTAPSEVARERRHMERMERIRERATMYGLGMRVYRTPRGYRGLVTSHTFDPTSEETLALLDAFDSDKLYIRLCRVQECFRARLTPKPYRMRMRHPPRHFPWRDAQLEAEYRAWERDYEAKREGFSACAFIEHTGNGSIIREIRDIVDLHDSIACTGHELA